MEKQSPNTDKTDKTDKTTADSSSTTKTSQHATRYLIIGTTLAIFNYGSYTILANLIINNNDYLWLSTFISTAITTILAYLLHSKITWKERPITKTAIYKFLLWNVLLTVAINPLFTQLFSLITPLYDFAYNLASSIFSYEFVQSTGAFILTAIITTILNFLFYDKFVFGESKKPLRTKAKGHEIKK